MGIILGKIFREESTEYCMVELLEKSYEFRIKILELGIKSRKELLEIFREEYLK